MARPAFRAASAITVVNARTHNLKNVTCAFPVGALTVVTGPSGSGKSSLAFDTLYAEGQRRFVESMSTYARQYLERLERPDVDLIEHILPALAIEQKAPARSARSTVGTATEIHDVLRLLYAAAGTLRCPDDGTPVRRHTAESVRAELLAAWGEGARVLVIAPRAVQLVRDGDGRVEEAGLLPLCRILGGGSGDSFERKSVGVLEGGVRGHIPVADRPPRASRGRSGNPLFTFNGIRLFER